MKLPELLALAEAAVIDDDFQAFAALETPCRQTSLSIIAAHSELSAFVQRRGEGLSENLKDLSQDALEAYLALEEAINFILQMIADRDWEDLLEVVAELQETSDSLHDTLVALEIESIKEGGPPPDEDIEITMC